MVCQFSDEDLEAYALRTLSEGECAGVEEHLLICPACQNRLAEIDEYVMVMRRAARNLEAAPVTRWRLFAWPKLVWGGALAAGVLFALWIGLARRPSSGPAPAPAMVLLRATRGAGPLAAKASKGTPLRLVIDVTELPALAAYRTELVDSAGRTILENSAAPSAGRLSMAVPGLSSGHYWVRLYTPAGQLLREFGLEVNGTRAAAPPPPPSNP